MQGTIHILRQHIDWVGYFKKRLLLLTVSTVFMLTWWVGQKNVKKSADVIYTWKVAHMNY